MLLAINASDFILVTFTESMWTSDDPSDLQVCVLLEHKYYNKMKWMEIPFVNIYLLLSGDGKDKKVTKCTHIN